MPTNQRADSPESRSKRPRADSYKVAADGNESECEFEGKTYRTAREGPDYLCGKGASDLVRHAFVPGADTRSDYLILGPKSVFRPIKPGTKPYIDYVQAKCKYDFFKKVYDKSESGFFDVTDLGNHSYRLLLPRHGGAFFNESMDKLPKTEDQQALFLAVLIELQRIHGLGISIIDIKSDNILIEEFLDARKKAFKVRFIDGGLHRKNNTPCKKNEKLYCDWACTHIAPEIWQQIIGQPLDYPCCDIYSLGMMITHFLNCKYVGNPGPKSMFHMIFWPQSVQLKPMNSKLPGLRPTLADVISAFRTKLGLAAK